ncbi:MAG: ornithine carbamoyltransferase [Candidatus Scalindua sp. AMX11]|nr:MAG: ornithine carbamoyltransferase [Candidatus Scalindua sp.]NOG83224.1 ornithine carbamoyltransferase [Planctomycetota bacterium]RZV77585.1 MAG: ornithine carbamoyltransferase [Candidatus Scalindua sp. SCAELEC01]TDE64536.1 MAG: ornithine carbamoyltransferase [Candidatus Scalindua sp. AMX11]GJQ58655.1 MAG: ornithine carbamoyltransferase [Candidatus Scalindua sp.]
MDSKNLVTIADLSVREINELFALTAQIKGSYKNRQTDHSLAGKTVGMIFEKSSMRTRVSFEVAMTQLGGHAIYLTKQDINLGERESIKDVAAILSRYVDCVTIRTYAHETIVELANHSSVPVINALSDYTHPCQALTDLYTVKEKIGTLDGVKIAFIGDGNNNVVRSLAFLCAKLDVSVMIASPENYELPVESLELAVKSAKPSTCIEQKRNPMEVIKDADIVYTDTWVSMGREAEAETRRNDFKTYQVNGQLMASAKQGAFVMHCLPAHRGEEITDEVIDGPRSIVYDQAENRLHLQKALLKFLICGKEKE